MKISIIRIMFHKPTHRYLSRSRYGVRLDSEAFGQDELAGEFVGLNQASATKTIPPQ